MKSLLKYLFIFLSLGVTLVASQDISIWLYGGGSYAPSDEVRLEYSVPPGHRASLKLYQIRNPELVLSLGGPQYFQDSEKLDLHMVQNVDISRQRSNYYESISLGKLPRGMYFAQLEAGSSKSATLILVTDLSLVVKSDQTTVLSYTANKDSGKPQKAKVYLLRDDEIYAEGLADERGLTEFTIDTENNLVVAAKYGDTWAFSDNYWSRWALEKTKVYMQTDRPVYRPKHTVFFKGTARSPSGLSPLAQETVQVIIRDSDGNESYQQEFLTDNFGSFSGEMTLSIEPPLGYYSIETQVKGERHYASFEVQEFQKPEYRVTVSPEAKVAVQGDSASFVINGEYLFGGAVAGAKVSYAVLKQPYYRWRYVSSYGFYEDYSYRYSYGGEMIERGEGVLDSDGNLSIQINLPKDDADYELSVQAGVTDEARREVSASGSLIAYRANLVLDIRSDRYAYKAGESAQITVRAEAINGQAISVPFVLSTERYVWESGSGSKTIKGQSYRGKTDEDGVAVLTLSFEEQGSYQLLVTAQDEAGRETQASGYAWVAGDSRWYWAYDGLTITADKEEYLVGDSARFVIQSPIADAYALISREGQELASYELVQFNGSVMTYELPITEAMTPNSYLSVVIVGNGTSYYETIGFRVPPVAKFLNVEITSDADVYQPQETGRFQLRVSDASGKAVRAQLSLGLVDEGIYLVRPESVPDIRGFFYALKPNLVGTQLSDWYYFGGTKPLDLLLTAPMSARAAMDEAVFAQSKADFAAADVREDFRDTIIWLPNVETDENGLATMTVEFPDNLTEWRLTARAITLTDKVGQNSYSVKTSLPVIARLAAPRFFIRGDQADLRVIGQSNLAQTVQGQLQIVADGLELNNPNPSLLELPAGGRVTADYRISASQTGTASITASALTSEASDAMKLPIPVLPHGLRHELGWAGSGSSSWSFELPEATDLSTAHAKLYLTPSLAAAVAPALSYLAGYPYGCTEQTMSRFYPSVLAAQAGELARLPEDVAKNLPDIVAKGLKRIYDFQHDDGGWGFWQYDGSSPFITAYVVSGLLDAQAAGYSVKDDVLETALSYLEASVASKTISDYRVVDADAKAYAYHALALAGRSTEGLGKDVDFADMSAYGLALSALALEKAGRTDEAIEVVEKLLALATERDQVAYFKSTAPRYYWNDDSLEASAYALEALVKLRPDSPIIAKLVNWLLLERKGSYWVSTKETAAIVKAALALAEARSESTTDYQVIARLNGKELLNQQISAQSAEGIELALSQLIAGENQLELTISGKGTLYSSANVSYFAEAESFSPDLEHFSIKRTYERLSPRFDEKTSSYSYDRKLLLGSVKAGDYVLVTVTIDPKDKYRYVLVNDPLPAGFRVIEDDQAFRIAGLEPRYGYDYYGWNYWYDGRELRDERIDFYFSYLGERVSFTYLMRAETPGEFAALPTQAWLMYEPEIRGTSNDARLFVGD